MNQGPGLARSFKELADLLRVLWQNVQIALGEALMPMVRALDYYLRRRAFRSPKDAAYDTAFWFWALRTAKRAARW